MGFVGGGSNIAIATALPYHLFCIVLHNCFKHQIVYGISLSYFSCLLRPLFLYVETNPGPQCPVPAVRRIFCSKVWVLAGNLSDLSMGLSQ